MVKVAWISAGVSSAIACYLSKNVDVFLYIDIEDHHPDSLRFVKDLENLYHKEIQIIRSPYRSVNNVIKTFGYVNGPAGAKCTEVLKRRVRKKWEQEHRNTEIKYVWGIDAKEERRAKRLLEVMPQFQHEFPLIEAKMTKKHAHGILEKIGIARPAMYDLGYSNNNCIGCVKGGMGYWNKVRVDFPEVFGKRAEIERIIGHSCINGCFLDELDPSRGRMSSVVIPTCDELCNE